MSCLHPPSDVSIAELCSINRSLDLAHMPERCPRQPQDFYRVLIRHASLLDSYRSIPWCSGRSHDSHPFVYSCTYRQSFTLPGRLDLRSRTSFGLPLLMVSCSLTVPCLCCAGASWRWCCCYPAPAMLWADGPHQPAATHHCHHACASRVTRCKPVLLTVVYLDAMSQLLHPLTPCSLRRALS